MNKRKTYKQTVLDAVIDLHNQELIATRTTVADLLGMKQTTVDDCLKTLCDEMLIYRAAVGVYVPVTVHKPSRIIYKAVLPDGTVKFDIGDDVITLTPKEARTLGSLLIAEAMQYNNVEISHQLAQQNQMINSKLNEFSRTLENRLSETK